MIERSSWVPIGSCLTWWCGWTRVGKPESQTLEAANCNFHWSKKKPCFWPKKITSWLEAIFIYVCPLVHAVKVYLLKLYLAVCFANKFLKQPKINRIACVWPCLTPQSYDHRAHAWTTPVIASACVQRSQICSPQLPPWELLALRALSHPHIQIYLYLSLYLSFIYIILNMKCETIFTHMYLYWDTYLFALQDKCIQINANEIKREYVNMI